MTAATLAPAGAGADDLIARLRKAVAAGRVTSARPLLAAVQCLARPSAAVATLHARVLLLENKPGAALDVLDRAIADGLDSPVLRHCRGTIRLRQHDTAGAAADLAEALLGDPSLTGAKVLLGLALTRLDRLDDALACLREAVAAAPGNPDYRQALAHALERTGAPAAAAATLAQGIALAPGHVGVRIAAIMLRMQQKDHAGAETLAEQARRDGVADACILGLLGHARSSLGKHEAAAEAYADARKLAPEDPYVRHLAAAAGLSADAGRASPEYVEVVFDGYAPRFDAHLISLGYRIPGVIRAELADWRGPEGPVLDLGCGTGLVGVALSDLPLPPLVGVDMSAAMLAEARRRGLYAGLRHSEICRYLAATPQSHPLILAADVLPYFGDLALLAGLIATHLLPGGTFLGSVEALDPGPRAWRLGRLGRYQHSEAYLRQIAAASGLALTVLRPETVRLEGCVPVPGLFIGMRKETE